MTSPTFFRSVIFVSLWLAAALIVHAQQTFDLVIAGGRLIDPDSGLDAIRHIGIRGDRIAEISEVPLSDATRSTRVDWWWRRGSSTFTAMPSATSRMASPLATA